MTARLYSADVAQGRARTAIHSRSGKDSASSAGVAARRGPTGRSARGGRPGRGRIPWLGLGLLLVIGVGVAAARGTGLLGTEQARSAEPTLTSATQAASSTSGVAATTAQPLRATGVRATAPTPTPVRAHATATPATRAPVGAASTATPRSPTAPAQSTATTTALAAPSTAAATPAAAIPQTPRATPASGLAPSGPARAGAVALTFDAGADRGYADDILDLLQSEHVIASFGITGVWARANPEVVRRMAAAGHLVINHTLDHRSFTGVSDARGGLSPARRRAELDDADAIIGPLVGHSTQPWYRLPYGDDDAQVSADVRPAGYSHKVGWSVDSLGWRGIPAADIVARCLSLATPGAVYVLHVGHASQDALALPQIIHGLREKGLSFHRVDLL